MLSIPYIILRFFRLEKCLGFSLIMLAQSEQHFNGTDLCHSRGAFQKYLKGNLQIFRLYSYEELY